jgi:hypothetical protein
VVAVPARPRPRFVARWIAPGAIALAGALGIVALWTVRASGGVCVDGVYEDTGEFYGYCADYSSASGALPATIAIVLLIASAFVVAARVPAPRRAAVQFALCPLLVIVIVAGIVANLTAIVYPPGYPA